MSGKISTTALTAALCLSGIPAWAAEPSPKPWTLHDAAGLPEWLTFSIEHRTRYETLDNAFRAGANGGDQVIAFRTNVFLEAAYREFRIGGEFIDSRSALDDEGTPVNTTLVDESELLQGYLAWSTPDLFATGLSADIKGGRQTIDLGSRRLVARNSYRNTINAFTGVNFTLGQGKSWQWQSFWVMPVTRLPEDVDAIRDDRVEFDSEDPDIYLAGTFLSVSDLPAASTGEIYLLYLNEDDTEDSQTSNRELFTPGFRLFRNPAKAEFDYELEAAVQTGTSRSSTSVSNTKDLDHFAYFGHAQVGYTFDAPWTPRFVLQYDYASGDDDPNDGDNNRFDTLYGARRFEFGPTSIWGAFARSNINSPGYRVQVKPRSDVSAFVAHRFFWLADDRDAWTGAGLRDTTGRSGDFIGQQIEASVKWDAIPQLLILEGGWAHLFKGEFAEDAPRAPDEGDSDYFYAQTTLRF